MPSVSLSPGRITACWFVLRCLERMGGKASRSDLITVASRSSLRSGGLPIRDGIRLAAEGRLISTDNDSLVLSEIGNEVLALGTEDEPTPPVRRYLVSRLLLIDPPTWVIYWQGDSQALDHILPANERKTLDDAGLLPTEGIPADLSTWVFWTALRRVPLVSETAAHRKALGDAGELLSLEYERSRLERDGLSDLAPMVRWLARESDAYGFDILSFVGGSGSDARDHLAIEVKSTSLPRASDLHFFLSAHEWETAQLLGERYVIHAWSRVDPGPPPVSRDPGPVVVSPRLIVSHLPSDPDCAERCRWQTAEIFLPS